MTSILVPLEISEEWFEQYIESAGYGISHWASSGSGKIYKPRNDSEPFYGFKAPNDDDEIVSYRLSRRNVADAVEKILGLKVKGLNVAYAEMTLSSLFDPGGLDAEVGDYVTQVAAFGEVVYG